MLIRFAKMHIGNCKPFDLCIVMILTPASPVVPVLKDFSGSSLK